MRAVVRVAVAAAAAAAAAFGTWPCFSIPRELTVLLHSMWQRFWAHGFVQCPFATNKAHELNFAAEETAMTAKTVVRRTFIGNRATLRRNSNSTLFTLESWFVTFILSPACNVSFYGRNCSAHPRAERPLATDKCFQSPVRDPTPVGSLRTGVGQCARARVLRSLALLRVL